MADFSNPPVSIPLQHLTDSNDPHKHHVKRFLIATLVILFIIWVWMLLLFACWAKDFKQECKDETVLITCVIFFCCVYPALIVMFYYFKTELMYYLQDQM